MVLEEMWRWVMNIRVLLEWCEMIELAEHVGSRNCRGFGKEWKKVKWEGD